MGVVMPFDPFTNINVKLFKNSKALTDSLLIWKPRSLNCIKSLTETVMTKSSLLVNHYCGICNCVNAKVEENFRGIF